MNILLLTAIIYLGLGLVLAKARLIYEWIKYGFFFPNIGTFIFFALAWPYMIYLATKGNE